MKLIKKVYKFFKGWDYRLKFLMVGGLNTIVGLGTYWIMLWILGINIFQNNPDIGWQVVVATTISQIVGVTHSYLWNRFFTFDVKESTAKQKAKFVCLYAVNFGIDTGLKLLLRKIPNLTDFVISLMVVVVTTFISFFGQKYLVFTNSKNDITTNVSNVNVSKEIMKKTITDNQEDK